MQKFSQLAALVKELESKNIWACMLEITTVIDESNLSDEQKQEAYDLALEEFRHSNDITIGANIFADAAVETVKDERYNRNDVEAVYDLFNENYDRRVR